MNTLKSRLPLILLLTLAILLAACGADKTEEEPTIEPEKTPVPAVTGAPSAAVEQTDFDHGDVPINQPIETTYTIRNVGDAELIFTGMPQISVVEGCCPPRVALSDMVLDPGEEATISIRYSMHEGMAGPHLFEITVRTNDPENPTLVLTDKSNWIE